MNGSHTLTARMPGAAAAAGVAARSAIPRPGRTVTRQPMRLTAGLAMGLAAGLALLLGTAGDAMAQAQPAGAAQGQAQWQTHGQTPGQAHERQGFWINAGLGYGSLGIEGFSEREDGLSGNLALGGTISPRFLLGAGTTGWTKEVEGIRINFGTLLLLGRFYPNAESGFFVNLGLGVGQVSVSEGSTSISESGGGALLGLGYDVRVGPSWSLTPFANAIGFDIDGDRADIFQFGVGVSFH